jgi:tRNA pseudouridine38-40 synthase
VEKNFKLTMEYDGSAYHGWQRQADDSTIQGTIESTLKKMTGENVTLIGSGRTDAGVHATGQVANFHCDTALTPQTFSRGLNSLLPYDIIIKGCVQVDDAFHARYDAKSKTYAYRIFNEALPRAIGRQYSWNIRKTLYVAAMEAASDTLIGTHDFKAFEATGSPRSHTTRQVIAATLEASDGHLVFKIKADGFLRYMVRNVVGALVDVGLGRITVGDMERIRLSRDRSQASATAPPHGLFLVSVEY